MIYFSVNALQYTFNSFSGLSNAFNTFPLVSLFHCHCHVTFQVVIPDSNTGEEVVVASLSEGNYFGEISLLRLDEGKNRLE